MVVLISEFYTHEIERAVHQPSFTTIDNNNTIKKQNIKIHTHKNGKPEINCKHFLVIRICFVEQCYVLNINIRTQRRT